MNIRILTSAISICDDYIGDLDVKTEIYQPPGGVSAAICVSAIASAKSTYSVSA